MLSLRPRASRLVAAAGVAALALIRTDLSMRAMPTGQRPIVRFLIGSPGGFNQRGFVQEYAKALQSIDLQVVNSTRRGDSRLEDLQSGDADLAINTSHAAYLAYSGQQEGSPPFDRLRALSVLGVVPVHLVVRSGSGIRSVSD